MKSSRGSDSARLDELVPKADEARQAVDSLRGYAYQVVAATLAWLDLSADGRLYLEVAEDFASVADGALAAVQVKDTYTSGKVTLRSEPIREAVADFVDLVERNPTLDINFYYLTTSEIGQEKAVADRIGAPSGLHGWRQAARGGEVASLRGFLDSEAFSDAVRSFVRTRDDAALRRDLLQRVHWACGQPNLSMLRHEVEERLVVLGRDRFALPAVEARGLADTLIHHVLRKSIVKPATERVLRRAELYEFIDSSTRVMVPRGVVDVLAKLVPGFNAPVSNAVAVTADDFFIDSDTLSMPRGLLARDVLVKEAGRHLVETGLSILVGGSGLGKSTIARSILRARDGGFAIVEFRGEDVSGTRRRIDAILGRLGSLTTKALLLEDIDHFEDARVALALGRLTEACARRDTAIVMTSYRSPSARAIVEMSGSLDSMVVCPYLSESEVRELVAMHGGEPRRWGRLAYVTGAAGHPQITHAFVLGLAARHWPAEALEDVLARGLTSEDTDEARDAARRSVAAELPDNVRSVLYRLSMTTMRFDRPLALAIGSLRPAIPRMAECLDQLIGPWIENVGRGHFRVSPLAKDFGRDMLPYTEKVSIHKAIAEEMLGRDSIDASTADAILMHALIGESERALTALAHSVMTAKPETLDLIAEHSSVLRLLRTDRLIFPRNPTISAMLRLAQFKLTTARGEEDKASDVVRALLTERNGLPDPAEAAFEVTVLATILSTQGVANYVDDWVDLLHCLRQLSASEPLIQKMRASVGGDGFNLFGVLFAVGASGLKSVERLEHVIESLGRLSPADRQILLAPPQEDFADHTVMIFGPYASHRDSSFDIEAAVSTYGRIAEKTKDWSVSAISIQCRIAQAVILDELADDERAAFAILDGACTTFGDDPRLTRERAKIHWRRRRYPEALELIRGIADRVGEHNAVDRAFGLREAGISAGKCGEWGQAEAWFINAYNAANTIDMEDMRAMAAGLRADAAVAAYRNGDGVRALVGLRHALLSLHRVDPHATLRGAFCHRAVRHASLWAQDRASGGALVSSGALADLEPGTSSNPDPSPDIEKHPLSPIDVAWYVLAEAEVTLGCDLGIVTGLRDLLVEGPITPMEATLRLSVMGKTIDSGNLAKLVAQLVPYVEAASYAHEQNQARGSIDLFNLIRGPIPKLPSTAPYTPFVETIGRDAIFAVIIMGSLGRAALPKIAEIGSLLTAQYPLGFPGGAIFESNRSDELPELDKSVLAVTEALCSDTHKEPGTIWYMALRLFEWSGHSGFKHILIPSLAIWFRQRVLSFVARESFRLTRPQQTIPPIQALLDAPRDDQAYIARLLLEVAPAVGSPLSSSYIKVLTNIADPSGSNALQSSQA